MRDPLAPMTNDPYQFLGLPYEATPAQAEIAMDEYNRSIFGHELEASNACATIRDPERRLAVDLLRYHSRFAPEDIETVEAGFERTLRALEAGIKSVVWQLEFGKPKEPVLGAELIRDLDNPA